MCVRVCLPAAIMFASASAQPYRAHCTVGGRPSAVNCWPSSPSPQSPLVFGDELQLLAQLEVSSRSSSASFNLPLTQSPHHPLNSHTHTVQTAHTSLPRKAAFPLIQCFLIDPWREGDERKRILWFPVQTFRVVFYSSGKLFTCSENNSITCHIIHSSPPHSTSSLCVRPPGCVCSCSGFLLPVLSVFRVYGHGHGVSVCVLWSSWRSWLPGVLAQRLTALFL